MTKNQFSDFCNVTVGHLIIKCILSHFVEKYARLKWKKRKVMLLQLSLWNMTDMPEYA